jgi:hypothetical protein
VVVTPRIRIDDASADGGDPATIASQAAASSGATEPAGGPSPVPADRVEVVTPRIRIDDVSADRGDPATIASQVEGVALAATIRVGQVTLRPDGEAATVELAAVDPQKFRRLTPEITAKHTPVWQRLAEGDAAFTHEVAQRLGLELGGSVPTDAGAKVRLGAQASNGTPPVADAILSRAAADGLDLGGSTTLLAAVADGAEPWRVAERLGQRLGSDTEVLQQRREPREVVAPTEGLNSDNVWDYLAMCESSGDWHINSGNGFYGGLQFLPESWRAVGGTGMPHEASREEQIYRAYKLWQIQGWKAWPACSKELGLR